jgi:toxin ParE1/3/4
MPYKIIWSNFAVEQLDEIYEYYKENANLTVAKKITTGIINAPKKLIKLIQIGQEEELLKHRKIAYRYLIHKNYKLIYSIDKKRELIKIADVFDTRQNPIKILLDK